MSRAEFGNLINVIALERVAGVTLENIESLWQTVTHYWHDTTDELTVGLTKRQQK
jgi:hypothetical protein